MHPSQYLALYFDHNLFAPADEVLFRKISAIKQQLEEAKALKHFCEDAHAT